MRSELARTRLWMVLRSRCICSARYTRSPQMEQKRLSVAPEKLMDGWDALALGSSLDLGAPVSWDALALGSSLDLGALVSWDAS